MKLVILFITLLSSFTLSANEVISTKNNRFPTPPPNVANDTVVFDLQNALLSTNAGLTYIDIPLYVKSTIPVSSFDFRLKFDQTKMTFVSTSKVVTQLSPYSYFNPNDNFLRCNVAGPSIDYIIPNNTPLIYARFQLNSSCTKVDINDFTSITILLKGYPCQYKITAFSSNTSTVNFTSGIVCSYVDVPFSYSSSSYGRSISSYSWNFGNGTTSNLQNPKVNFDKDSTYSISLVTITDGGCKDSISKSLLVNKSPVSNFSYVFDKAKDSVFFFNIIPLASAQTLSWEWNFGDLSISTTQDPVHQYNVGGFYSVSLLSRTDIGCTNKFITNVVIDKPSANFISTPNKCTNATLNFTNTSTYTGGTIVSWDWDFDDNTTSTLQNPTHIYTSAGTYTVKLVVTSNTGSKGTVLKTIIVNNKPIVQFDGDNLSGCSPLTVNFSDLSTTDTGSSYFWDFGDYIISADQFPTHTFLSSRAYTVKEVITAPGGCKDSLIKTSYVTVLNAPITDFTNSSGCVNSVINFTDKSTVIASSIISWEWSFGDNSTSTLQNPTHIYSTNGSYTVTLTTTTNLGCTSTLTRTLIINSKPIVQFNTVTVSGCTPLNVVFGDISSTATGSTYNWSFGDNSISNVKSPTHIYTMNGSFTVKEVVIAPGGCSDSLIKTAYINVLSAITPSFTEANRCSNLSTLFKDNSVITAGTITTWNWDFGNGSSSSIQNPSFVYISPGKYTVKLTATSDQGCSNSFSKEVVIDAKPIVNFKVNQLAGCVPETIIFSNLSIAPDSSTYSWSFGDGSKGVAKDTNHTYSSVDSFTVKYIVTSPQGCMDSLVKSKYISLKEAPKAAFTIETTTTFIPDLSISFLNKSEGATKYYWDFGDLAYSGLVTPKHAYSDSGNYEICLTASSSEFCSAKICDTITIISSKKLAIPSAFSPNGDNKNDVFKLLGGPCKELNFKIFNEWGNVVFESYSQEIGWDGTYKGDLQPIGTYNYTITGKTVDDKTVNLFGIINLTK